MNGEVIAFWALAVLLVGSALNVVLSKNLFHSVLWLAAALIGTAGVFLALDAEFLGGVAADDAAAGVEDGALGLSDEPEDLFQLLVGRDLRRRGVRVAELDRGREDGLELRLLHVLRDVDHDRAGTAGARHVEGLVHGVGQLLDRLHQVVVLGAGPRDAGGIGFLKGIVADQVSGHLAGQAHDRDGIHQRVGEASHGICGTRAGGHQHDADLAGRARVAFGGVHRRLLVTDEDVTKPVLLEDGVIDRKSVV